MCDKYNNLTDYSLYVIVWYLSRCRGESLLMHILNRTFADRKHRVYMLKGTANLMISMFYQKKLYAP